MIRNSKTLLWIFLAASLHPCFSQNLIPDWEFDTGEKVLASAVAKDGVIYIGSQNGKFYAIDSESGKEKWTFDTGGNIQAKALVIEEVVFFESANIFYLLDRNSGKQLWKYDTEMTPFTFKYEDYTWEYKIDPFDDKRSSGTFYDGVIYVGAGNGKLYGFQSKTGKVVLELSSDENAAIRTTPFVVAGHLFYGDWNGKIYCYDLNSNNQLWVKKTFRGTPPYSTFGGVVSEFLEYDGLLFVGARNPMMNVLSKDTGEKEWTYTDPDGGWMIGDPVIFKDTLYIGGSDNFSMFAFEPKTGKPLWKHHCGKNIYTKPIVTDKWVIFTGGNAYNLGDVGNIFMVDRMTGEEIASYETPRGIFSSPHLIENKLIFGCYDGKVYSLKIN